MNLSDTEPDRKYPKGALEWALYLVRTLGCKVIPLHSIRDGSCTCPLGARCTSAGKHPVEKGWKESATDDEDEIHVKFTASHPLNIGVLSDSIAVLDKDKHSADKNGFVTLRRLEEEYGELPATPSVRTGTGGHDYFRVSAGVEVPGKTELGDGLELLGAGRFVVGPGSRHKNGQLYDWEENRSPEDVSLADITDCWLLQVAGGDSSVEGLLDQVGPLSPDADVRDVQEWTDRLRAIARDVRPEDRVLFRIAAANRLAEVKSLTKEDARQLTAFLKARHATVVEVHEQEAEEDDVEEVSEEVQKQAEVLLHHPRLLDLLDVFMEGRGLVGEAVNRRVCTLAAVSGLLEHPIHLTIKGASSGGKQELITRVCELLPPDRVLRTGGLSAKALQYRGGRITGVFILEEIEGAKNAEYVLRVIMSEGRFVHMTVNRSEQGRNEYEEHEIEVAASVFTTTTQPLLNPENESRFFSLFVDDSIDQTDRVLERYGGQQQCEWTVVPEDKLAAVRAAMAKLQRAEVRIPFAMLLV